MGKFPGGQHCQLHRPLVEQGENKIKVLRRGGGRRRGSKQ